ncbi:hypothetical protein BDB01DRAFT_304860 [Pilobolus umbonatus]|nr:hypothetical protein BDB01DRAFT_304860 [Pilobolus umbonatus]
MLNKKTLLTDKDNNYFNDAQLTSPWLDDMITQANEVLNALLRLRKQQMASDQNKQYNTEYDPSASQQTSVSSKKDWDFIPNASNISTGSLTLNTTRQRKRGKRAVFQGRCYSCNISETPEWRRGPHGARTLCNACGLHYAKLAKKKAVIPEDNKETIEDDTSMK